MIGDRSDALSEFDADHGTVIVSGVGSEMLQAALAHASRGRPVFPCRPEDKRPYTKNGFKDATTDHVQITERWRQWPSAMIGMPTGKRSRVWALDVDVKGGIDGNDSLFELCDGRQLPDTVECLTPSGGRHIYFIYPDDDDIEIRNSAKKIGQNLDVRGEGGYVILPPSKSTDKRHPGTYEWEASSDPDDGVRASFAPDWLVDIVKTKPHDDRNDERSETRSAEGPIQEGKRNDTLFRLAASLRAKGLTEAGILGALRAENEARCNPALPDEDIVKIAGSAGKYSPGRSKSGPIGEEPSVGYQFQDEISDDTLALTFAEAHPHLRYVEVRGKWMRWNGACWDEDSTGHTFSDIRSLLRRTQAPSDKQRKAMLSARTVAAVERLSRYDRRIAATIHQWNQGDWVLNTPAGIVDLTDGAVNPHTMDAYHTKITAVAPGGACRLWHRFLHDVTGGDLNLVSFLQRVAGYGLTGSTKEHALFFLFGTGANGKGTFLNTLTSIMGNYAKVAGMETFTDSNSEQHPTSIAALQGSRLVVAQETEEGRRWAEAKIKSITGGDPVTARYMRQDEFTYTPKFKLLIAGNHKPRLKNVDEAMRRRFNMVPFTITVPAEKRDPDLAEKLKKEWPGILQWAIDGCARYLSIGLNPPSSVVEATSEYFVAQDLFSEWVDERCDVGAELWETPTRAFASWKMFCETRNERPGRQAQFGDKMEAYGFNKSKDHARGRYWIGVKCLDGDTGTGGEYWT